MRHVQTFVVGFVLLPLALVGLSVAPAWSATIDVGSYMVYDDVLDITWVRDPRLCVALNNCVNRYDDPLTGVVGGMRWNDARTWAANLVFQGYDDWRLPWISVREAGSAFVTAPVDCRFATEVDCRDNELGYMERYNLPNLGSGSLNLRGEAWSGQGFDAFGGPGNGQVAWGQVFLQGGGNPDAGFGERYGMYGWAVRNGNSVACSTCAAPVPEPSTFLLVAIGLVCAGLARCQRT